MKELCATTATGYSRGVRISIALITLNEETNLSRTLDSVMPLVRDDQGEIIVVDSGSTDRTVAIAQSFGARVFLEPWKGFAAQKNSAMEKGSGDWVLQLDADESLSAALQQHLVDLLDAWSVHTGYRKQSDTHPNTLEDALANLEYHLGAKYSDDFGGLWIPRKNYFLGRWIKHGGFYPDPKLRLIRRGAGKFEEYGAHPTIKVNGPTGKLKHALIHNAYPTLRGYIDHMNSYSSSGAEVAHAQHRRWFNPSNIVLRPMLTFVYNYVFRLGFLDGREGLLLHLYHSVYVSWKYAKAWERAGKD